MILVFILVVRLHWMHDVQGSKIGDLGDKIKHESASGEAGGEDDWIGLLIC